MATKILTQIWNETTKKFEAHASFDTVDAFCAYAVKFKQSDGSNWLQVHIPGGFVLSGDDIRKIEELGVERF